MAPSMQRTTPDRPVARLVGNLLIFVIVLVALAATFFVARGFNQYREALAALPLDEMERNYLKLLHSKTGAAVARDRFGVSDEIYNAIFYHTTGKADMTLLEKIIYLADYIEPSRSFPGVEELRTAVHEDLDRGLCRALADSIVELQGYGSPVHPNTQEALSYIQREIGGTIE